MDLPPLDIPTALSSVFFPTIGALMHLAGCRVNRDVLKICIYGQSLEDRFKNPHVLPLPKAAVDSLPWAISLRKFSPRRTSSGNPQYPIHCTAVITFCRASAFPFLRVFWRQHIFDSIPFTFCEFISFRSHINSLLNRIRLCNFYFSNMV